MAWPVRSLWTLELLSRAVALLESGSRSSITKHAAEVGKARSSQDIQLLRAGIFQYLATRCHHDYLNIWLLAACWIFELEHMFCSEAYYSHFASLSMLSLQSRHCALLGSPLYYRTICQSRDIKCAVYRTKKSSTLWSFMKTWNKALSEVVMFRV